ncbi:MAG: hypothetical protein A2144_11290 [Chloroflexi bacterium RBG_16_50_9]|nr:MAG: hypothetical protein A2144_11290 [Chloroflexi bacterium RBG_16_50_9]
MKWPPYLLKIRFRNSHHSFAIWLPLFLIGPIVLVLSLAVFLILLPFALLAMLFTWRPGWWRPLLFSIPSFLRLLCFCPGLKVDVENKAGHVYLAFF